MKDPISDCQDEFRKAVTKLSSDEPVLCYEALNNFLPWINFFNENGDRYLLPKAALLEITKFLFDAEDKLRLVGILGSERGKAWKISERLTEGYLGLSCLLQHHSAWEQCITLAIKALSFDECSREARQIAHFNLGTWYNEIGQLDRAVAHLEKALAIDPRDKDALFNLGMFLGKCQRFPEAIAAFERYLVVDATSSAASEIREALFSARKCIELNK